MAINLAVIYGSRSCEHDVSVVTGLQAMGAAEKAGMRVVPVYISKTGEWYTGESVRDVKFLGRFDPARATRVIPHGEGGKLILIAHEPKRKLLGGGLQIVDTADVVLPTLHGPNGEDGTLQGMLQLWGVPFTSGGVLGSSVCMDKIAMKLLLKAAGFPALEYVGLDRGDWEAAREKQLDAVEAALPYPMYVKPANLGSSIGITRATDRASLKDAIDVAAAYDRRILVEKGVEKLQEVNCSVLGYGPRVEASVLEMPVRWEEFLTFDEKYLRGANKDSMGQGMKSLDRQIPAPIGDELTARVREMSVDIFRMLDLKGVVRIDYIIDEADGGLYVGEVNTIPGSLSFYLWEKTDMPFPQLIERMVEYALLAQADQVKNVFSYDSTLLSKFGRGAKGAKG